MSQSSLNWDILNTVQGRQCHIVFPNMVQNRSTWPKLARQECSKLLEMTQTDTTRWLKIAQKYSKLLKVAYSCSKLLKMFQNYSKCLKMGQQVSIGVMCLHIQVRKLSLLGIAVAGVYCCMGLRSMSIEPRSCLLLRSEPSTVNFNWQGSLVIRLAAIVSINGLSRKNHRCFDRKHSCPHFLLFHYCLLMIPCDTTIRRELLAFFVFCWDLKGIGSKPDGSHPKLRTVMMEVLLFDLINLIYASIYPCFIIIARDFSILNKYCWCYHCYLVSARYYLENRSCLVFQATLAW